MDSNRLHYFSVVAETGSIRRAAELLRLSPAALSKAVKLLEEESGLRLLTPSGRGIAVTDSGRELARRARPLLDGLDGLAAGVREGTAPRGAEPIRIGSFEVFTTHFLALLMKVLPAGAPLLLRETVPGELERALLAREIDLGITYIPIPAAGVDHQKAATLEMGIYARAGAFSGADFAALPFAVPVHPVRGSPNKVQGLDGWPDGQVPRKIGYRVTLMESALELCRLGLAAAYLPSFVVRLHNETARPERRLRALPLPHGMQVQRQAVYLVKRSGDPEDGLSRKVARALRAGLNVR